MDRGAWWATAHGGLKVEHTAHIHAHTGCVSFLTLWNKHFLCASTPRVLWLSLHAHNQGVLAGGLLSL